MPKKGGGKAKVARQKSVPGMTNKTNNKKNDKKKKVKRY